MKHKIFLVVLMLISLMTAAQTRTSNHSRAEKHVAEVLDRLNEYAAKADFKNYFSLYAEDSQFIGTDANEIWNKKAFMAYAKPHFDKGKAWSFKSVKRNITFSKDGKHAWFDELLDTQMKLCRGSGVLQKIGSEWKIRQYVLSMTVPNDVANDVIKIKSEIETKLIDNLAR